jgi:hypothetical protein
LLLNEQIRNAVKVPGLHWILAPSYRQAKSICWTRLKALLKPDKDWRYNEQELYAEHPSIGTRIELRGADNEDSLRGTGLKSCGLDECATMKSNVWPEIIRPMLADSQGPALFISTPKGRNWFYELFIKGFSEDKQWKSWKYPTSVNQYIQKDEIEQAKKDMSERLFKQEFMAEFLDDETGVFKFVRRCITGEFKEPILGRFYVMGVDLARTLDFSVLTIVDSATREIVAWERFQDVSWTEQKFRIQKLAHKYNNALCVVDSSGVGDPIFEDLQNSYVSAEAFKFTNESKAQLIEQLEIAIEQRMITFPDIEVLVNELLNFEYKITNAGNIQYGAPEGKHDDCVISLALAVWGIRHLLKEASVIQQRFNDIDQDRQGRGEKVNPELEYTYTGY